MEAAAFSPPPPKGRGALLRDFEALLLGDSGDSGAAGQRAHPHLDRRRRRSNPRHDRLPGSGTRRAALRARNIFHRRPKACWETSGLDYVCDICRNRRNSSAAFSTGKDNIRGIKTPSAAARRHGGRTPPEQGRSALCKLLHIHSRKLAVLKAAEQRTYTRGPLFRQRSNALAVRARTAQKVTGCSTMDSGVDAAHRHLATLTRP